jgi:hypothetical protein
MTPTPRGSLGPLSFSVVVFALASLAMLGCGAGENGAAGGRGARGPLPAPRVILGELDAKALLGDVPARSSKLGAGPMSLVASGETVERERLGGFVVVPSGMCLLAYARASSSIDDLDVAAFADEGNPLASDDAPDAHPTILMCPPHPDRVYVTAVTASGEGLVALGVQFVPPERAADVGRAMGARGTRFATPRAADAWVGLDDHVRSHREGLGGKWEEFRRVAVSVDARVPAHVAFPLEADGCTDALIVPDDDVAVLEVEAVDESGRAIARAGGGARDRFVTVCSPLAIGGSLVIRPHIGQGLVAIILARAHGDVAHDLTVRPDVAWASGNLTVEAAKGARNGELAKSGYAPPESTQTGTLAIGRLLALPLDFGGQKEACARVDVVAGAPLALLHAEVWDDRGGLVTRGEGVASVTLFDCSRGKARLELEARGRPGPYASLVRPERWKDPLFLQHPLAASRMLARTAVGPSVLLEGTPLPVRAVSLDASHLLEWDESIPAGKCLRIGAGAEGEGMGLEGRLIERVSGDEIDRSHADHAIAMRACATPGAARSVHVEIRATAGRLDLVVGERLSD